MKTDENSDMWCVETLIVKVKLFISISYFYYHAFDVFSLLVLFFLPLCSSLFSPPPHSLKLMKIIINFREWFGWPAGGGSASES